MQLPNKRPVVFVWNEDATSKQRSPLGSGFILGPNGDILTAKHVATDWVEGQRLVVSIATKEQPPVSVDMNDIECHPTLDFCFLRINADVISERNLTEFYPLRCGLPMEGEPIITAGFYAGAEANTGVVTPRGFVTGQMISGGLLPTDVAMEPGMSGGPVFDGTGAVVGLVKGGSEQFGYFQPLQRARSFLESRGYDCPQEVAALPADTEGPNIDGEWRGGDGEISYSFRQSGARYEFGSFRVPSGTFVMGGEGTITGRELSHTFETLTGETGECTSRINAGGDKITGSCLGQDGGWAFVLERW